MDMVQLDQFPSVAANARSTLVTSELIDSSVYAIVLEMGGTTFDETHLDRISIRLDGKSIVDNITGTQMKTLNTYDGITGVTNFLFIWFSDPTARTIRGQHFGALDCSIYRAPLEVEIDIGGATAPTLKLHAVKGPGKMEMGMFDAKEAAHFRHIRRTIIEPTAAVDRNSYRVTLGARPGANLRKMAFFHANLTKVELEKQSIRKWDNVPIALNSALAQQFARSPQSGLYVLDRIVDGNQGEAERTVDAGGKPWLISFNLTTSAADKIYGFADLHASYDMI